MNGRRISDEERKILKGCLDDDVDVAGGVSRVCEKLKVSASLVSRYTSINDQNIGTNMPIDVLLGLIRQLIKQGGRSKVLAMLADEAGLELVPKIDAFSKQVSLLDHLADLTARASAVQIKIMQAEADGQGTDSREAAEIMPAVKALISEGVELEHILEHKICGNVTALRGRTA
jgi:hypothetical protein